MQSLSQAFSVPGNVNCAYVTSTPHRFSPSDPSRDAQASRKDAGPQALAARSALGLDSSQTSPAALPHQMHSLGFLRVDSRGLKVKRARFATLTGARLHMAERPSWIGTFVGLTYGPDNDYNPKDISRYIDKLREWCDKHSIECRYVWVAEMQKRGVIHYHLIVFHPKRLSFPKPDKSGMWPHGSSSRSTGIYRAVAYMAKYLSKGDLAPFPKGARTYGSGGFDGTGKVEMRYWKLPTWVRDIINPSRPQALTDMPDVPKRVRGGFVSLTTGELYPSPWDVFFKHGSVYVKRRIIG